MATDYSITISMDSQSVTQMQGQGYQLYAFKAANGPPGGGKPVVWFSTDDYSLSTKVSWSEQYSAYTASEDDLSPGNVITASAFCPIDLGQVATVTVGGVITVTGTSSDPDSISILNSTTKAYTCGIAVQQGSGSNVTNNPTCAFPLSSGMTDEIAPIEQVFLMFATDELDTGAVVEQSYSWGALIDLTADHDMRASFSLANPTQWLAAPGVTPQPPNTQLVPLLINP